MIQLAAAAGRVIACPFIPGEILNGTMAMVVIAQLPEGLCCRSWFSGFPLRPWLSPSGILAAQHCEKRPRSSRHSFPNPHAGAGNHQARGGSLDAFAEILRNAVRNVDNPPRRLGSRIAARFKGVGLTEDIPELRGQPVQPAQFNEP